MIVLQQLRNPEKPKEKFVENRLKELRELHSKLGLDARYVHTSENPEDAIFQGITAAQLHSCAVLMQIGRHNSVTTKTGAHGGLI